MLLIGRFDYKPIRIICQRIILIIMQGQIVEQQKQTMATQVSSKELSSQQRCRNILHARAERSKKSNKDLYVLCEMDAYYKYKLYKSLERSQLNKLSVIPIEDEDRLVIQNTFQWMKTSGSPTAAKLEHAKLQLQSSSISRGIGAILGMAIADALGASTQFMPFRKDGLGLIKTGFKDIEKAISQGKIQERHGKVGVWTDDASMGLCIADSILLNDFQFNPKHIRHLFILWLHHGLDNGGRRYSIGLGGNISISMDQFLEKQQNYTEPGNQFNNGNGSLMRLAPVPVAYSDNLEKAILYSGLQSLTTHNGIQAQECCRLMANIIVQLINRKQDVNGKQLMIEVCDKFQTKNQSVRCLARGQKESQQIYDKLREQNKKFKKFNKTLNDRNWNWRDANHTYSPCRYKQQPGYIGSYCMDALAMALHTVYFSNSFLEVAIKNADMGGDCDTVGSIAAQIAGAIYGIDDSMLRLYSEMEDFTSGRCEVFLKAYKLAVKKHLN